MLRIWFVTPEKGCQRTFLFNEFFSPFCVVDGCLDLAAVANNTFVLEQTIDITLGKARYLVEVEMMEGGTKVLALGKNGAPAQSGLKPLKAQFFK